MNRRCLLPGGGARGFLARLTVLGGSVLLVFALSFGPFLALGGVAQLHQVRLHLTQHIDDIVMLLQLDDLPRFRSRESESAQCSFFFITPTPRVE